MNHFVKSLLVLFSCFGLIQCRTYCQPNEACWPSKDEINQFKASLSSPSSECLQSVPTFTSHEEKGPLIFNTWYNELGPLIFAHDLMLQRTYVTELAPFFTILPRNDQDVSAAVQFAAKHNLAFSVFSTGHEFQDRNAPLGPNGLLVRTTCLRSLDIDIDPSNRFGNEAGVVRIGSGMTWGTSKFQLKGVQEEVNEYGRVVVTGHAAEVGVVGWSLGGGHSPLGPFFGLGVDQILEVELVGPDGSFIHANSNGTTIESADGTKMEALENDDLFWALRGGGAGPWGVVTAITFKLHYNPYGCKEACYTVTNAVWRGVFSQDNGALATSLTEAFISWAAESSRHWSGYFLVQPNGEDEYYVILAEMMYVGLNDDEDAKSLQNTFFALHPDQKIDWSINIYNTYFEKTKSQTPESIYVAEKYDVWASVLFNKTTILEKSKEISESIWSVWVPRCYMSGDYSVPCIGHYMLYLTLPKDDNGATGTAISKTFREADLHFTTSSGANLNGDLDWESKAAFIHEVVAPQLYQHGEGSYYSESEYTMEDWKNRLWDAETYARLLTVKQTWDPEHFFGCRHCIGDEEEPMIVSEKTLPSWRWQHGHH